MAIELQTSVLNVFDENRNKIPIPAFKGDNGDSAYEVAVKAGFQGSEADWLLTLEYSHSDEFFKFLNEAKAAADSANQSLSDMIKMRGVDFASLVDGKIPASQIPTIATTEIYYANNAEEQAAIKADNGDILIRSDESKSYIWKDTGWVYLASPTDFAARAGYAETAGTAENADKINNHRMVQIARSEWETAVKDPNTYYLVYDPASEV